MVCTVDHRRTMLQNGNNYKIEQTRSNHGWFGRSWYFGYTAAKSLEHACKYLIAWFALRSATCEALNLFR